MNTKVAFVHAAVKSNGIDSIKTVKEARHLTVATKMM